MTEIEIKSYYTNNMYAYKIYGINYVPQMTETLAPLENQLALILAICILYLVDSLRDSLEIQADQIPCLVLLHKRLLKYSMSLY